MANIIYSNPMNEPEPMTTIVAIKSGKGLNPNTLVSCHGYYGDSLQIRNMLRYQEHHQAPLVIVSPEDSRIERMGPHICRFAGKRAYIGDLSLDRQFAQMRVLLEYPFEYFLANDSDSLCISPRIPEYLYKDPHNFWSNEVSDAMHVRKPGYAWPQQAFQPPYFFSRQILERMVATQGTFAYDQQTPFIDWVMMAICHKGKIPHKNFRDGISCPTSDNHSRGHMVNHIVQRGATMLHSVKTAVSLQAMVSARLQWSRAHGKGMAL